MAAQNVLSTPAIAAENASKLLHTVAKELYTKNLDLDRERSRLDQILTQVAEVIFAVDQDYKITLFNSAAEQVFETKARNVVGKKANQHIKIYDGKTKELVKIEDYAFTENNSLLENVTVNISPEEISYFKLKNRFVNFGSGNKEAVITMANITQEVELGDLKDEFVSIASHELRTPMTAIKSYLWMVINQKVLGEDKKKHYLEVAYKSTEQLIQLVQDMLTISRIEGDRLKMVERRINLNELVQQVYEILLIQAREKGIKFAITQPKTNFFVRGDKSKLTEVLQNILGNAIKFTPKKGKVSVDLSSDKKEKTVTITVKDNGPGIPKKDLSRLFVKFGRIQHAYNKLENVQGTGLGLYVSKKIINLHKGKINVESKVGKGTTFYVTLPELVGTRG